VQYAVVGLVIVDDEHAKVAQTCAGDGGRSPTLRPLLEPRGEPERGAYARLAPHAYISPIINTSCLLMARPSPVPP
jgi:hypothetical protein